MRKTKQPKHTALHFQGLVSQDYQAISKRTPKVVKAHQERNHFSCPFLSSCDLIIRFYGILSLHGFAKHSALNNAIEACQRYDKGDKAIHVMAVVQQDFFISVRNTSEPVVIINGSIPTTKPEPQLHGFGLANIRLILEKYSGEYTMFYENGWFQFTADIPFTPIS